MCSRTIAYNIYCGWLALIDTNLMSPRSDGEAILNS